MQIKYKERFQVQRKQSPEFLDNAHAFIDFKLQSYLSQISKCTGVVLSPLGGGIKNVVYVIETDANQKFVLKICKNKNYYWNEVVGMDLSAKAGLNTIKRFISIEEPESNIYGFILENIQAPILKDKLKDLSEINLKSVFLNLGRDIKKLHDIKIEGYIEFDFHSYTNCTSTDPYYFTNYMLNNENKEIILQNDLLKTKEVGRLLKYLKTYEFNEKGSVTHGDLSITNTFYLDNNRVLLFDFQSAGDNPLFDLATFKYRCFLEKQVKYWEYFLEGYGSNYNHKQLDQLLGIISFRKLANAHMKGNKEELNLSKFFIKSIL